MLWVLAGMACASSSSVTSVRDPHYTGLMHAIVVAVGAGGTDATYPERLAAHLQADLARHRVVSTARIIRQGTVNQKDLMALVERAKPEGVLALRIAHGIAKRGVPMVLTYEATLLDTKQGDRIWNARIDVRRATGVDGTTDEFMSEVASQVVQRLAVDRLIEPAVAQSNAAGNSS